MIMITEKHPNSDLKEWRKTWKPEKKIFSSDFLSRKLQDYEPRKQEDFWKGDLMTAIYDSFREYNRFAYSEIIDHIFTKYLPRVMSGVEFGCGARASYFKLLPKRLKENWLMIDISRTTVSAAKIVYKVDSEYCAASFHSMPLKSKSQELVTGLNSFETTMQQELLFGEILRTLKDDGYLLAIQDVIPNEASTLMREFLKNSKKDVTVYMDGVNKSNNDIIPILLQTENGLVDSRSYHLNSMKDMAEKLGMKTLFSGIIESTVHVEKSKIGIHDMTKEEIVPKGVNSFVDKVSELIQSWKDLPKDTVQQQVAVNSAIFQK